MNRTKNNAPHLNGRYINMNIIIERDLPNSLGNLWLGDRNAARNKGVLRQKGISTVLTMAQELFVTFYAEDKINHKKYDVHDNEQQDLTQIWVETNKFIDEARKIGGVLVHCAMGVSRSASTVIAYVMQNKQWGYQEAFDYVKFKRSCVCPNPGFRKQLMKFAYESEMKQESKEPAQELQQHQQQQQNVRMKEIPLKQRQKQLINNKVPNFAVRRMKSVPK